VTEHLANGLNNQNCSSLNNENCSSKLDQSFIYDFFLTSMALAVGLVPVVSCPVDLQAVGLLLMWMILFSHAPLMFLLFDCSVPCLCPMSLLLALSGCPFRGYSFVCSSVFLIANDDEYMHGVQLAINYVSTRYQIKVAAGASS
jgi:hypothetical protein